MTSSVRAFYKGNWLMRAGAAKGGIYRNDGVEATYPSTRTTATGEPLGGTASSGRWAPYHVQERWPKQTDRPFPRFALAWIRAKTARFQARLIGSVRLWA
jgi:hypothetical protein